MLPPYFTLSSLRKAVKNPRLLRLPLAKAGRKISSSYHRLTLDADNSVMEKDWDILLILDACRFDSLLERKHLLPNSGTLSCRVSSSCNSMEFMERTFHGNSFHDTVYVTANPYVEYVNDSTFHATISLLDDEFWCKDLSTVRPEIVAEQGIQARERFPNKRLILHFMQPHYPFIGPRGHDLPQRGYNKSQVNPELDQPSIWSQLRRDPTAIDMSKVRAAYHENLEIVLEVANGIIADRSREKITITADHGNFLGEHLWPLPISEYGHPEDAYGPMTAYVPWYEIEGNDRPEIQEDQPIETDSNYDNDLVQKRLASLGYRE